MPESVAGKISILMPAYNEGKHIYRNIKETEKVFEYFSSDYEIVVVDDGSQDNTRAEIERAASEVKKLKFFSSPENRGKGWALKRAFQLSSGEHIFFLDSDLDIHPRQFHTLFQIQSRTQADVVIGSKRHPQSTLNYPRSRKIISSAYFLLVRLLFGLPLRDTQTGIKLFRRRVLENILPRILVKKYAFDLEILVNAHHLGFKIAEAPVVVEYKGKFGRIGPASIWTILVNTLAIYYRDRILGYYNRPLQTWSERPLVSILIALKKASPYLKECLLRIKEMTYKNYEVILLPDEPMEAGEERIRVISTGPISPPRKRDRGAAHARGEMIAFIDDDAHPQDDWLEKGIRHFADDAVAAVGGPASTASTDNFWEQAGGRVLSCWMVGGVHLYRYIPKMPKEVDDYPTSNLIVRKSAFRAVGGFQAPYWPGEDTVLCWKLTKKLGKKILYDPDVQVWHHRRPLFREHWRQIGNYGLHRGYFVKKFPETSRRFSYFLPCLWTIFLIVGWLPLLILSGGLKIYAAVVLIYLALAFLTGVRGFNLKTTAVVTAGIVTTHLIYGLNFLRGMLLAKLKEE